MKSRVNNPRYLEKYFTQFPNIIDDSELDPYEFRLLLHYYRVGECWEGVRKTASICKMSTGKVATTRKALEEKGFITISGNDEGVIIDLVDLAQKNLAKYSMISTGKWSFTKYENAKKMGVSSPVCIYCGTNEAGSYDHLIPISKGGSDDPENKATSCAICNKGKGSMTNDAFVEVLIRRKWMIDDRSRGEQLVHDVNDTPSMSHTSKRSRGEHKNNHSKNNIIPSSDGGTSELVVACYKQFVDTWHSKYPVLLTMPKDGAKIKSIIKQVIEVLKTENWEVTRENVLNFWTAFVGNLHRTWGHNKDLSTIDSKLKSLFLEMKPKGATRAGGRADSWEQEFAEQAKY